jgi:hypothetical protein
MCTHPSSQLTNILSKIITGDERRCFQYDPENKVCDRNSQHSHNPRKLECKNQMKIMLIIFFSIKATVHYQLIPQGQTVNQTYYVEILKWLCEAVHRKRPELWPNDCILHHDNTPFHKALCQAVSDPKIDY